MKTKTVLLATCILVCLTLTNCTDNPKNDDPTSTITPGNNLDVDSATAHRNNTDSLTQIKNNRTDSSTAEIKNNSLKTK